MYTNGTTAYYSIVNTTYCIAPWYHGVGNRKKIIKPGDHFRFESKLKLGYQLRESFTNKYGETDAHIISEVFRQFPVAFGLQKDSIFTEKFGEIIG